MCTSQCWKNSQEFGGRDYYCCCCWWRRFVIAVFVAFGFFSFILVLFLPCCRIWSFCRSKFYLFMHFAYKQALWYLCDIQCICMVWSHTKFTFISYNDYVRHQCRQQFHHFCTCSRCLLWLHLVFYSLLLLLVFMRFFTMVPKQIFSHILSIPLIL